MKRTFWIFALILLFFSSSVSDAAPYLSQKNRSGAYPQMASAEYWIERTKHATREILSDMEISEFSKKITNTKDTYCTDITAMPYFMSDDELKKTIEGFKFPEGERYQGDKPVTPEYYRELLRNMNLDGIPEGLNEVKFGFAVRNTPVRVFPTEDVSYTDPNDVEFDMNQQDVLKVWDEAAILHTSSDGKWYFVRTPVCDGWVCREDIAIAERKTLKHYRGRPFLVVTGNRIFTDIDHLKADDQRSEYLMGTKLYLSEPGIETVNNVSTEYSYAVVVPAMGNDGSFRPETIRIPFNADVSVGYIPYTAANIIKQAFKVLGERYGWGRMWKARDCSSFMNDVFLTFGLGLPRNSGSQAKIEGSIDVSNMDNSEKLKLILKQPAGTVLYMKGHVMMCLGSLKGIPYVIHDAYSYGPSGLGGSQGRMPVNCVTVSDLDVTRKDGSTFLSNIRNIVRIR